MDFLYSFYVRRLFLSQQIAWILKEKEEENKKTEFPYCLHSDGNIDYFVDYLNNIFFFSFFHIDWYIWFLFFVKWLPNLFIKGCNCFFFVCLNLQPSDYFISCGKLIEFFSSAYMHRGINFPWLLSINILL